MTTYNKHAYYELQLNTEHESKAFAQKLARSLNIGDSVLLTGDLGSGKTFICREIIKSLCGEATHVISPTFNILQTYESPKGCIYHFDLYRIKSKNELIELGVEDAMENGICLVEWPDLLNSLLRNPLIEIRLKVVDKSKRLCILNPHLKNYQ